MWYTTLTKGSPEVTWSSNRHRKSIWQSSTSVHDENSDESGYRGNIPQLIKGHLWQTHREHHTRRWKLKAFPVKSGRRQGCPPSWLLFYIVLEVLTTAVRQEKEIKGIQIRREELKLSPFADDVILYTENTKVSTKAIRITRSYSIAQGTIFNILG